MTMYLKTLFITLCLSLYFATAFVKTLWKKGGAPHLPKSKIWKII